MICVIRVYRSSTSAVTDQNFPASTSQPSEGSGNPFPCDESDDEDCDEQYSGSSSKHENQKPVSDSSNAADGNQRTGSTRTDAEEDGTQVMSSSVSLTASMSRLKDKEGPSNTTTTTTTVKPGAAASIVAAAGSLQSTTAATPPPSVARVSAASVGSRRGASPSSRNEETDLGPAGGGGVKGVSSTGDDGRGQPRSAASNVGLIVGVVVGVLLLLLVLAFALYKYRSRDEGTYKIDNRNYTYEVCSSRTEENGGGGGGGGVYKLRSLKSKQKRKDVKEWYV